MSQIVEKRFHPPHGRVAEEPATRRGGVETAREFVDRVVPPLPEVSSLDFDPPKRRVKSGVLSPRRVGRVERGVLCGPRY